MKKNNKSIYALFFSVLILTVSSGCRSSGEGQPAGSKPFSSYREIPGVTADEINAIEGLRETTGSFIFGMMPNTEIFLDKNGGLKGFTAFFCEWLTELFGIPFVPAHVSWQVLLEGLESGEIDFSGTLTSNEERRRIYYMTDAIAQRNVKYLRLMEGEPLSDIAKTRLPRYALLAGSTTVEKVLSSAGETFEPVFISEYIDAYELLKTGQIDALVAEGTAEAVFDVYGDVIASDFLPLVYTTVSLATQNPQLAPIISVVQKALENGADRYLGEMYNQGYREYLRHKLFMQFSEDEINYIQSNPIIPLAAEYDNYPISFFNSREGEWQGVAIDVLRELESFTGLKFEIINDNNTDWPQLLRMLESAEALMLTELFRTPNRENRFLWPESLFFIDQTALISKLDYPDIRINDIMSVKVGLSEGTAHTELFWRWFPDHHNAIEYNSKGAALEALMNGDVDMVMTYLSSLLYLTHYQETLGFKANFVFNHGLESTFGINKDEVILWSIVNKALGLIDNEMISGRWLRVTYDYRLRLTQAQMPWIIFAASLLLVILIIILIFQRINAKKREVIAVQKAVAANYNYSYKLSGVLKTITKSPAISEGVLKDAVDLIIREGCIALNATRVGVWKTMEEENVLKSISCYDTNINDYTVQDDFELSKFVEYTKLLETERLIIVDAVGVSGVFSNLLEGYGPNLCALIDVPIRIDGMLAGTVCIEQDRCEVCPEKREWSIEEQNFASSLADIMALAISGAQRRAARDEAVVASRAKSEFLANMSHEIRTPMNSIMGFAELAMDKTGEPSVRDYLRKISDSTKWLLKIINDILDISKIESGKMELEKIPFDLTDVVLRCQSVILPGVKDKGLELSVYSEPVNRKKLLGDPVRLYQALINLLSNAVKFTKDGTIKFSSAIINSVNNYITVYFEIKDTGIGMNPGQIQKIFDPFTQADSSTTRNYGGTGLGLAITKNIVELMGGKLVVNSLPGIGSTFSFKLVFDTIDSKCELTAGKDFTQIEKPHFDALILVCDDNTMNQEVISEHLSRVGIRAVIADNGKIGVDIVQERMQKGEKPFDLIFMDMFMPVMDGMEAASIISALNTGTPIVAMTANIIDNELEKYKKHGMPDCLGKPFTTQELWTILLKYLPPVRNTGIDLNEQDDLLKKMLQINFAKNYQAKYSEIVQAIESADLKLAHRLVHTLKGNAGMIGKIELQDIAKKVEAFLKAETIPPAQDMDILEAELKLTLDELKPLLDVPSSQEETAPPTPDQILALFEKLEPLLDNLSPECLNLLSQIRAVPGADELARQIENYDFESANQTLIKLKKGWM